MKHVKLSILVGKLLCDRPEGGDINYPVCFLAQEWLKWFALNQVSVFWFGLFDFKKTRTPESEFDWFPPHCFNH